MTARRFPTILAAALFGAIVGALLTTREFPRPPLDTALLAQPQFLIVSILTWCLLTLYWEHAAKSAAPAKSSESSASRALHLTLVNLAVVMIFAPLRAFGRYAPPLPALMLAGLAIQWFGTALAIWSRRHLGTHWSGAIQIKQNPHLVRTGPYRLVRHPIYTGILAMYLGPALVTGEWLAVGGFLLAIAAYLRKIRLEESTLAVAFGAGYDAYRRETWSLVPGLY